MTDMRLGFLASHNGTDMRAIVTGCEAGNVAAIPRIVISNNRNAECLAWAREHGLRARHLSGKTEGSPEALDLAIRDALEAAGVTHVVLSGYMRLLGPQTLSRYVNRILNVHPALLPKFGGKGMYGAHVHEAVLASGDPVTGVTIHLATAEYDEGAIIDQTEVPIEPGDTPAALAARTQACEQEFFPRVIHKIATGEIDLDAIAARR